MMKKVPKECSETRWKLTSQMRFQRNVLGPGAGQSHTD